MFAVLGLIYASIVPLEFQPLSFAEAIKRFPEIPWLNLGVYRRADWVANGLVAFPFGFLLAGAADRDSRTTGRYALALLAIIVFGNALVVAIEFLQLWYPRRTVSQNDIAAGCIGATIGPLAWMFVGRPAVAAWRQVRRLTWDGPSSRRITGWLLLMYLSLLIAYSVLPLDIMFSGNEWQAKWQAGRFAWVPELNLVSIDLQRGTLHLALSLVLSAARMLPVGLLLVVSGWRQRGLALLIGVPILIELLQAPIFTRFTTFADALCGWGGGLLGMVVGLQLEPIARFNDRLAVRVAAVVTALAAVVMAFLGRYERIASDAEVAYAWSQFWTPPFVKYYYTSEFMAGSNLMGKLIAFSILGGALCNAFSRPGQRVSPPRLASCCVSLAIVVGAGVAIEISQIYLVPFYGDAADVLIYAVGAFCGWGFYRSIVTWGLTPDPSSNGSYSRLYQ
ncbi:VanZ like family protein [Rosistilla ulvae]|uniref:VanZ like family protein n=2 Tax=Rosistilla ulvae TaxID=1930277 RepID=A0A517M0D8_9BACT|nr:VanZ like family protein [Rosistilla ulvae]